MGTGTLTRFAIGILVVGLLIFAAMVAQGIGESIGHGIQEWMVR